VAEAGGGVEGEMSWRSGRKICKRYGVQSLLYSMYMRLYEHCGRQEGKALLSLRNNMWLMFATYIILTSCDS